MNEIENEIIMAGKMADYFGENLNSLPIHIQLQVLSEFMKFSNALKPLYIVSLSLRGDKREDKAND